MRRSRATSAFRSDDWANRRKPRAPSFSLALRPPATLPAPASKFRAAYHGSSRTSLGHVESPAPFVPATAPRRQLKDVFSGRGAAQNGALQARDPAYAQQSSGVPD